MKSKKQKWGSMLRHILEDKPLTTFEVSRICGVVHTTVSNWVDDGKLPAFKTPGGHRRVKREALLLFLKLHQIPVSEEILQALRGAGDEGPEAVAGAKAEASAEADSAGKPEKKILIIEDDESIGEILFQILTLNFKNVQIFRAIDGFEAGKFIAREAPDLVILDLILPGIDGFRILRNIREDAKLAHTKIIAATGYDESENRERILQAGGVDGFLVKPIDVDTFKSKVRSLLYRPQ